MTDYKEYIYMLYTKKKVSLKLLKNYMYRSHGLVRQ